MAEERIDPFQCDNYWRVDHLSRYIFALSLCRGKTVLDAACGLGYGAAMMANNGAEKVIGVDNSATAIESAAKRYAGQNVSFQVADLEQPLPLAENSFDLIVSFETLEHLEQAQSALENLARVLSENGILIISVPGENDAQSDNPYHKQHFTKESFLTILRKHFSHITLYHQILTIGSTIHSNLKPFRFQESVKIEEVGQSRDRALDTGSIPDSYVAVCGNRPVPEIENAGTSSRQLWLQLNDELKRWKDYALNQEAVAGDIQRDLDDKTDDYHRWQDWGGNMQVMMDNLKEYRDDLLRKINELNASNTRQQNEIDELKKKLKQV